MFAFRSLFPAKEFGFGALGVNFRHLAVDFVSLRVNFRPLYIDFCLCVSRLGSGIRFCLWSYFRLWELFHDSILDLWKQILGIFGSNLGLLELFRCPRFGFLPLEFRFECLSANFWYLTVDFRYLLVGFGVWETILGPIWANHEHYDSQRQKTPQSLLIDSFIPKADSKRREILRQYLWNPSFRLKGQQNRVILVEKHNTLIIKGVWGDN